MQNRKQPRNRMTAEILNRRLFVTPAQVMELFGLSRKTANKLIEQHFPVVKLGPRSRRIPAAAVRVYLETSVTK